MDHALLGHGTAEVANPIALRDTSLTLAGIYVALAVWSLWKLAVFASVSWPWTGQKSIHLFAFLAASIRAAFFFALPSWPRMFFLVEITSPAAPLWLTILDTLPQIFTLAMLSVLTLTWASSYYSAKRNEFFYQRRVKRPFKWLFGLLCLVQAVIWVVIGAVSGSNDALAVAEGTMYAVCFLAASFLIFLFGKRTSSVALGVSVLGLTSRSLLRQSIMVQAVVCSLAFALRALISFGAACAAAVSVDDTFDESSIAGISVTFSVFLLLDILPVSVLLLMNRRALGKAQIPGPAKIMRPVVKFVSRPFAAVYSRIAGNSRGRRYNLNGHQGSGVGAGGGADAAPPGVLFRGFSSSSFKKDSLLDDSKDAEEGLLGSGAQRGNGGSSSYGSSTPTKRDSYQAPALVEGTDDEAAAAAPSALVEAAALRLSLAPSASAASAVVLPLPASLDMARSASAASAASAGPSAPTSSSSLFKARRNIEVVVSAELVGTGGSRSGGGDDSSLSSPFSPGSLDPTSMLLAAGGRTAALARAAIASAAMGEASDSTMVVSTVPSEQGEETLVAREAEESVAPLVSEGAVSSTVEAAATGGAGASKKKGGKKKGKQ